MLHSVSKKKWLLAFPALFLSGLVVVFCHACAIAASDWVSMSLAFLPILLSSGIFLSLGILLIRIYAHEVKQLSVSLRRLLTGSIDLILGTIYLSLPPILLYLLLWIVLGFFYLLRELPGIGTFFGIVFAAGPFLLILASLLLCLFNLGLLFFVAPAIAIQASRRPFKISAAHRIAHLVGGQLFSGLIFFLIASIHLAIVAGLLLVAASLTKGSFLIGHPLEWFFIMIPFCAFLTPVVVFFFNFATECHWLLQKKPA